MAGDGSRTGLVPRGHQEPLIRWSLLPKEPEEPRTVVENRVKTQHSILLFFKPHRMGPLEKQPI